MATRCALAQGATAKRTEGDAGGVEVAEVQREASEETKAALTVKMAQTGKSGARQCCLVPCLDGFLRCRHSKAWRTAGLL